MSFIPSIEDPLPAYRFLVSLDPSDAYLPFALLPTIACSGTPAALRIGGSPYRRGPRS